MLERVSACLEPRVHQLARSESPTRSLRLLHPSFWRHGPDSGLEPSWWPAYLQDIREIASARHAVHPVLDSLCHYTPLRPVSTVHRHQGDPCLRKCSVSPRLRKDRRRFTSSQGSWQATAPKPLAQPLEEGANDGSSKLADIDGRVEQKAKRVYAESARDSNHVLSDEARALSPSKALQDLIASDEKTAYDRAWHLFIRTGRHTSLAPDLLLYLSTSASPEDRERAIRVYALIPSTQRLPAHYYAAMASACELKRTDTAVEIHDDVNRENADLAPSSKLFAYLISNNLWRTLAQVLDDLPSSQRDASHPRNRGLWSEVDQNTQLPEKVLGVAERLKWTSPSEMPRMRGLLVQLLHVIFRSSDIMAVITGPAVLALLKIFYDLNLLQLVHYRSAISTLHQMISHRARTEMAMLLYRDLDQNFPLRRLSRSMLGSLIIIFCESTSKHEDRLTIMRRFARDYGKPDEIAYQKVMSACADNGDSLNVNAVFAQFRADHGMPKDLGIVTPLLYTHARLGDIQETKTQLQRLYPEFGLQPDVYCWNILLTAYHKAHDHHGAFQAFQEMKAAGIHPNDHTFGTLMSICARLGDTATVHQLAEAATRANIRGTIPMVVNVIQSYCQNEQIADAEDLVETATELNLDGNPTDLWNVLLRHHAHRADTHELLRIQERMKALSIPGDELTYAALMQCLVNVGKTKDAVSILRSLHMSNSLTCNRFHYTIVLYGFVLEDNLDMVSVVYNEMRERFSRVGLSAHLSRLHSMVPQPIGFGAGLLKANPLATPMHRKAGSPKVMEFLTQILLDVNHSDVATRDRQPGLGGGVGRRAFPSAYFEFLIGASAKLGALKQAKEVFDRHNKLVRSVDPPGNHKSQSFKLMSATMIMLNRQKRYEEVDQYWHKALAYAIREGQPLNFTTDALSYPESSAEPPLVDASKTTNPMTSNPDSPKRQNSQILPAYRTCLVGPLTQYMRSLEARRLTRDIPKVIEQLEQSGFSLSSTNWNLYIQLLAASHTPGLQTLAFQVFEETLLPKMAKWKYLANREWSREEVMKGVIKSGVIARVQPNLPVPTYKTMVYLAAALQRLQRESLRNGKLWTTVLEARIRRTLYSVRQMPYLRDRYQGSLLWGRTPPGKKRQRLRHHIAVDPSGLQGSTSPIDQLGEKARLSVSRKVSLPQGSDEEKRALLYIAESISGEIERGPLRLEAPHRLETGEEHLRRLQAEETKKLHLLEQARKDMADMQHVADARRGDPVINVDGLSYRTAFSWRVEQDIDSDTLPPSSPSSSSGINEQAMSTITAVPMLDGIEELPADESAASTVPPIIRKDIRLVFPNRKPARHAKRSRDLKSQSGKSGRDTAARNGQ